MFVTRCLSKRSRSSGAVRRRRVQVNYPGEHFDVEDAKLFDKQAEPHPIGVAVSGRSSCEIAGEQGDFVSAVEPKGELIEMFREAGGKGKPGVGQIPVCWGPDEAECLALAREQFRWAAGGWKVMAEIGRASCRERV